MSDWIKIKQPYGIKHIHPASAGCVEQYKDQRDGRVEVWGDDEFAAREPVVFDNLRAAKKAFTEKYLAPPN